MSELNEEHLAEMLKRDDISKEDKRAIRWALWVFASWRKDKQDNQGVQDESISKVVGHRRGEGSD